MPIAKITGQGLIAMGFSVALLWGCFLGQRAMFREAYRQRTHVMHEIEVFQRRLRPVPVSTPFAHPPTSIRLTAG